MLNEKFVSTLTRAWKGDLELSPLIGFVSELETNNLRPLAIILYQTWLNRTRSPFAHAVYFNMGVMLGNENDLAGAEDAYRHAINLNADFLPPRLNLGLLYERQGQLEKAIDEWRMIEKNSWREQYISATAVENRTVVIMAINHLARVIEGQGQFYEALALLNKSLVIEPNQPDVMHHWVHLRQKQCLWPVYAPLLGVSQEFMRQCTSQLAMLNISDDPAAQLQAANNFVKNKVRSDLPVLANSKGYGHSKIRVAYLSSDFCMHAVAMLMVEVFELHDREQFDVYGFCWSPEDNSEMRRRIMASMDHFIRIKNLSDEAAARLIREYEIDILIDLQGQTSGARVNILDYRPAPIQITYLGLPATTGLPSIDYVIADRFLIPEHEARHYSEKPLYMPDIYQVSDRGRSVASVPSRESLGLPAEGFVFCSSNNSYKYTPEMFEVWMNILRRSPGSVLWLLGDNQWMKTNLRLEAEARGIDRERLIFIPREYPEHYRARFALVDLFLDTFPFNAGATANEVLWMGTPVLTCSGRAFASRMAGALLTAAKLDELITYNLMDYEEKAVWLAQNPEECLRLRERLTEEREHGVIFDTPSFVRNLENRFKQLIAEL